MNYFKPIYTEKADCQDCYKCVRMCPVKSIKVDKGSAAVIYENCILCGECVLVCPSGAKKTRNDLDAVKNLLKFNEKVIVSLAPSFISEFSDLSYNQVISAIKKLGFYGVSETALGAQEVSANIAKLMKETSGQIYFSTACPSVVEYVTKYHPESAKFLTPMLSPLLSQCKILKKEFGQDSPVVFIGPCIAKKKEADDHPDLLDAVLTFQDLREWFKEARINPALLPIDDPEGRFLPLQANEGILYPVEGGMIKGIKHNLGKSKNIFMSFSGIKNINNAITGIEKLTSEENLFVELLACESGCINGPKVTHNKSNVIKRYNILKKADQLGNSEPHSPMLDISQDYLSNPVQINKYSEEEIANVLADIGKIDEKYELNCAGCGYNTCKEFAASILDNKSEKMMCVTYMRQLAQKKANALIATMPSGIVIVDDKLKIVESNLNWAKLIGEEAEMMFDVKPGLEGASLVKMVPFHNLFQNVIDSGIDIVGKEIEYNGTILLFSIFTIEKHKVVGSIFRDITEPWEGKEQIITKAKQVIKKNLSTVQKIAYLLGENASETEIILNGIIESFSKDKIS
ncbi:MAG: [Fe-Fe] hydrogenase large subunit C-terminal domain-containing protein [Bacteroidota bacterium]|nr:[Fe-Fe] hydrogenase large subunit C-terminal domain-containing protein [Bacteroidota bacterium]